MKKHWYRLPVAVLLVILCLMITPGKQEASADAIPDSKVTVDYKYETLTVETDDNYVYYTESYTDNLSKWSVCEVRGGKASFDISWVKSTSTVRLYLCGDKHKDVISKEITWQERLSVSFTGTLLTTDITEASRWKSEYAAYPYFSEDTGYFIFTLREDNREKAYFDLDNIEWRKGDGGAWREFDELDLKEMNIRGVTLNFRVKAVNESTSAASASSAPGRSSTVAKIAVAKLAFAPEVKFDIDRMTVDVKNGQEISFDGETWLLIPEYYKRATSTDVLVTEATRAAAISKVTTLTRVSKMSIYELLKMDTSVKFAKDKLGTCPAGSFEYALDSAGKETGVYLYIRTAGTEKKAASIEQKLLLTFMTEDPASSALKFSYVESKTATGGINIQNTTKDVTYEVAIIPLEKQVDVGGKSWKDNIDLMSLAWTSVRPERTLRLANSRVPKGAYIIYRVAAEKDVLPSAYLITDEAFMYDYVTYAGITGTERTGEKLTAVVSTNLKESDVTYEWQRTKTPKDETSWESVKDAAGAAYTEPTYTLTADDMDYYFRVIITSKTHTGDTKTSDPTKIVKKKSS